MISFPYNHSMPQDFKYKNITVSGKIAVGTTTLAKSLTGILDWKYVNAGELQRMWDREHGIDEIRQGATARPDERERDIDERMTKRILQNEKNYICEGWLSGFMAQRISGVLKVLLVCSDEAIRIDRVVNRDRVTIEEAKRFIRQREEENISKWKKLYGDFDFWDPSYYDLVIDTFSSGPMQTLGKVLDKLGYKNNRV